MKRTAQALALVCLAARSASAEGLDWEPVESAEAPAAVLAARNVRDGVLGFGDAFFDANTAAFGSFALLASQLCMGASDAIGLVDDNPVTQHVTKALLSKNLAKVAWLWHDAGAESLLGSHGLEAEYWARGRVAELNPLLSDEDVSAIEGPLPRDPLAFVGEATFHRDAYQPLAPLADLGATIVVDGAMRPAASLLRIAQLRGAADALDERATRLWRRAIEWGW
jgi:hypothetical protein